MPRQSTIPTLFDEVLKIESSKFIEWGYFEPYKTLLSNIKWSRNGEKYASISIYLNTQAEPPYVELDYKYNDQPKKYKVYFESVPSNLGRGVVWYFVCPFTNKRCRKLYQVGGYFGHRTAFKGCYYETQTYSAKTRQDYQFADQYFGADQARDEIYSKHFKKFYAGQPTKRYKKLFNKIRIASMISEEEFCRRLMG